MGWDGWTDGRKEFRDVEEGIKDFVAGPTALKRAQTGVGPIEIDRVHIRHDSESVGHQWVIMGRQYSMITRVIVADPLPGLEQIT